MLFETDINNMEVSKRNVGLHKNYIIAIHLLFGVGIFYFLVHPFTMIIYWFEMEGIPFSLSRFWEIAPDRFVESFSFQMTGMSFAFILIGLLVGAGSGLYYKTIVDNVNLVKKQDELLKRNILTIIKEGESERVEFKSSLRYDYNKNATNKALEEVIAKTIAGFLNTNGGELLIGVDDQGNILGLQKDYISLNKKNRDGFELKVFQIITNNIGIEFCSLIQLEFYDLDGKDVCLLRIAAAQSPAYVLNSNKTAFYVRAGNSTKPLTIKEAVKYINSNKG